MLLNMNIMNQYMKTNNNKYLNFKVKTLINRK